MCPLDSAIRAVSALRLGLATMRRNVRRRQNNVRWDRASIGRNIGQNGMSPNTRVLVCANFVKSQQSLRCLCVHILD